MTIENVQRLLEAGEIPLFEDGFARLAGIRLSLMRRLIYEIGGECLVVLCRALDATFDQASSILALTRSGTIPRVHDVNGAAAPVKAIYGAVSCREAGSVRDHWKRQSDYLSALREAERDELEASGAFGSLTGY